MTVFSTRIKALALFLMLVALPVMAQADDRDTYVRVPNADGSVTAKPAPYEPEPEHHAVNSAPGYGTVSEPTTPAAAVAPSDTTPVPTKRNAVPPPPGRRAPPPVAAISAGSGNIAKIESFGTLSDPRAGALGIDMWDGSHRDFIADLIPQLPNSSPYRIVQSMIRRVLLTKADVAMLAGPAAPGPDLLTLRIEKLMAMGALDDAAALYKENPLPPANAAMAEAGIAALFADDKSAVACLENKALSARFGGDAGWDRISGLCDYLLGRLAGRAVPFNTDSHVLQQMGANGGFRYTISSVHDFEALTPFERMALVAAHRVDYSRLGTVDPSGLTPLTLSMIVHDTTAPATLRFNLLLAGARVGIFTVDDIANFYKAMPFTNLAQSGEQVAGGGESGWQRIAWIYKSADAQHGQIDKTALQAALAQRGVAGLTALWPFAPLLQTVPPEGFGPESIRSAMLIALITDNPIPAEWGKAWNRIATTQKSDLLIRIAYKISGNPGAKDGISASDLLNQINNLPQSQKLILSSVLEMLDKGQKLHKSNETENYANEDLTQRKKDFTQASGSDKPMSSLLQNLQDAENDRRLGETILLSSMALSGVSPEQLSVGIFRQALNGYQSTGLTKETRELAMEAVLDLK